MGWGERKPARSVVRPSLGRRFQPEVWRNVSRPLTRGGRDGRSRSRWPAEGGAPADTCASNCIVTEAGGKFTDMNGNVLKYNIEKLNHENGLLVTNGIIHNKIIETYKKFS